MKMKLLLTGLAFCAIQAMLGQIKIGENPQTLDPGSVLELESTNRALVITRLSTAQMNSLSPLQGALVYNTDVQCIHYYDGSSWINLCEASAFELTNNPIINTDTTIALIRVGNQVNIEVDTAAITTFNIKDRDIRRDDLANGSVGGEIIQNRSVTLAKFAAGGPNQVLKTNAAGDPIWANPDVLAMGKVNGSVPVRVKGANVLPVTTGVYNVILDNPRPSQDYIIQLSVYGDYKIQVTAQFNDSFIVSVANLGAGPPETLWYFTVLDF